MRAALAILAMSTGALAFVLWLIYTAARIGAASMGGVLQ